MSTPDARPEQPRTWALIPSFGGSYATNGGSRYVVMSDVRRILRAALSADYMNTTEPWGEDGQDYEMDWGSIN